MKRWLPLIALLATGGCVSVPDEEYPYAGGYYGGGYYYDHPRDFDYDVQSRFLYGRTYYYPPPYYGGFPDYYGGYYRRPFHDDHDAHGHDDGSDRNHDRGGDSIGHSPGPRGELPAGPGAARPAPTPSPVPGAGGLPSQGPHGRH